jgi:hypothetical protein
MHQCQLSPLAYITYCPLIVRPPAVREGPLRMSQSHPHVCEALRGLDQSGNLMDGDDPADVIGFAKDYDM